MSITLFLLGRPGSGKSTVACRMIDIMEPQGWSYARIKDYETLHEMFQHDTNPPRFKEVAYGGFDVKDFSVLKQTLQIMRSGVKNRISAGYEQDLIIVEFARNDYREALKYFEPILRLPNTYVLYIEADVETCIRRIHERINNPIRPDNHFVSDEILRSYYSTDTLPYIRDKLAEDFHIATDHIKLIDNNEKPEKLVCEVDEFIEQMPFKILVPVS